MKKRIWIYILIVALLMQSLSTVAISAGTLVTRCNLYLRAKASAKSDALVTIPGGTEITGEGRSGGWTKTTYNGHTGYVSTAYLMELTKSGYYPLKTGDNNPYVIELQKRLIELGYLAGTADGKFEKSTYDAVKSFQKANKIAQDGVAGGGTQRVMFSDAAIAASGQVAPAATGNASATETSSTQTNKATLLRKGDRSEDVRTLQNRLIELGYLGGKADGVYGASTEDAVKAFQKKSSLTVDGKAGNVTQALLYSNGATKADGTIAAPAAPLATVSYKTLKRGMTNNDVKTLQQTLKDLGYFSSNTTGYFGTQTQLAVEKFQKEHSLKADGIAGTATLELLFGVNAKPNSTTATDTALADIAKYGTLKEGMKSTAVTTMQKKLKTLGYFTDNATGFFGTATKKAVTDFQKANKLKADGVAGAATLTVLYGDTPILAGGGSSTASGDLGTGKITGPSPSSVKLLHWFNSVKPSLKSNSVVLVYDPVSHYAFNIKALSLGRHFDSEPLTADDTKYLNAAFGGVTTWTPKPVWVKLPSGTWTLATMHNTPHLTGSIQNNNFNGHLCIHFFRDMAEAEKNDPKYGVQHQKAIRDAWKNLTGQVIN